jgi:hypothetical protein
MTRLRAAGCALVVAAAGCTGEGGGDFAGEANALCADYDDRIAAIETPGDLADLAASAEEIAVLIEEGTAALRELEPPEDLAARFEEWLALNDEAAENAREISAAAEDGDQERIVDLAELAGQNEAEADALAEELGLDECLVEEEAEG